MRIKNIRITNADTAKLVVSKLMRLEQLSSELFQECETFQLQEHERVEFKMQIGKLILSCNEFIMNIVKVNKATRAGVDQESIQIAVEHWKNFLGPERAESPMILINADAEKTIIYSSLDFAELVLVRMEQVQKEIDETINLIDKADCSEDEKLGLRAMVGYFVGFYNAIHLSIFADHPALIPPDSNWREMMDDFKRELLESNMDS